ncbi:MAG TPA: hypothetical protein VN408_29450 [Actinoplanes sp.]|nr:hypothetical protein [Actinoplanes sp.]
MSSTLHALQTTADVLAAAPTNPFDGVVPNFTVFGTEFNTAWKKVLGALWALAFAAIAVYCVSATVKFASAKKQGYEHGISESARDLKNGGIAAGLCAGLPIIFSAILSVIG